MQIFVVSTCACFSQSSHYGVSVGCAGHMQQHYHSK